MNHIAVATIVAVSSGSARADGLQTYRLVDLGLGGHGVASWACDLDEHGEVVGAVLRRDLRRVEAFRWKDGAVTTLGTLPDGRFSAALAINDDGIVVGMASRLGGFLATERYGSFIDRGTGLEPLAFGANNHWINDVNDAEHLCGASDLFDEIFIAGLPSHAFVTDVETFNYQLDLGGTQSEATAVNAAAHVVGGSYRPDARYHAFHFDPLGDIADPVGVVIDLGTLGGRMSCALDVNDANVIVGFSLTADGARHAVRWSGGGMTNLGTLGGAVSEGHGVDGHGRIVGTSWTSDDRARAFLYEDGVMVDLNDRLSAGHAGWIVQHASAISDAGWITGWGRHAGETHALVLVPMPSADLDGSGAVNDADLGLLLAAWGPCAGPCAADLDGDGAVGFADLIALLLAWS